MVVRDFSSLGSHRFGQESNLGAHLREDPGVAVEKANLHHDGGLGAVRRGNDHVDLSAEALLRQGVELDLAGLSGLHLLEVRLRHVGLDLQGVHVGNGDDGRLGVGGGAQGVTMSPMSAFLVRTTASKGARRSVYSTFTLAPSRAASAAFTADSAPETPAMAFL